MTMKNVAAALFAGTLVAACSGMPVLPLAGERGTPGYCDVLSVPETRLPARPAHRPFLGIYLGAARADDISDSFPCREAVLVGSVVAGTAAADAGIREGDRILTLDGHPVCGLGRGNVAAAFKAALEEREIGSRLNLSLLRDGTTLDVTAVLGEQPVHVQPAADRAALLSCGETASVLGRALEDTGTKPAYDDVVAGLALRSNTMHNADWFEREIYNPFQSPEVTAMLRHPAGAGRLAGAMTGMIGDVCGDPQWSAAAMVGTLAGFLGMHEAARRPAVGEGVGLEWFIDGMEESVRRLGRIRKDLSESERDLLGSPAPAMWEGERWNDYLESSLSVDRGAILGALEPVVDLLTGPGIEALRRELVARYGDREGILFEQTTEAGSVLIGGAGPNTYAADAALILDLGGDDVYLNNAGGTRPGIPAAVVIDWGGNDIYYTKEPFSQGSGSLGGGFLVDLGGDDIFLGGEASQGTALVGIGFLLKSGGRTLFSAGKFSQGLGQWGIGLVVSRDADSSYEAEGWAQGIGLPGGAGVLVDTGGDDAYSVGGAVEDHRDPGRSTVSMGQGFGEGFRAEGQRLGVSGGIGVLLDTAGDDRYLADYFAQGSSYYYGLGILDDRAGRDRYVAGRYAQGAGIHSSVGVLLDGSGADSYITSFGVSQGMGHDFGVGVLVDDAGDDLYRGGTLVQGAATRGGLGLLLDGAGEDTFLFDSSGGGYAQDEDCIGIFMDLEEVSPANADVRIGVLRDER